MPKEIQLISGKVWSSAQKFVLIKCELWTIHCAVVMGYLPLRVCIFQQRKGWRQCVHSKVSCTEVSAGFQINGGKYPIHRSVSGISLFSLNLYIDSYRLFWRNSYFTRFVSYRFSVTLLMFPKKERKKVKLLSCVQLFVTPWTVAYRAPPSMGFSRQKYWSRLPFPYPGDLPNPGIEPGSPAL